jgi:hypothetical protein
MPSKLVCAALLALLIVPPALAGSANLAGREVELAFSEGHAVGFVFPSGTVLTNTGTTGSGVRATAMYANNGVLKVAKGRGAGNLAIVAPAHITSATATPKSAVIKLVNTGATDLLDPGTADFSFGADFVLNTRSATASSKDNGDNLIQRGLASSATQWKIQIDGGRPSCVLREKATGVQLIARTPTQVVRGSWYRAVCTRTTVGTTTTVSLTVSRLGTTEVLQAQKIGPVIDLSIATSVPMSVGGKITDAGALVLSQTDQFNGRIDNAFLDLP